MQENNDAALPERVAQIILEGFYDYFEEFHRITIGARQRFISSNWKACQQASKDRLNMYLDKILTVKDTVTKVSDNRVTQPVF